LQLSKPPSLGPPSMPSFLLLGLNNPRLRRPLLSLAPFPNRLPPTCRNFTRP
jgi:hypothetical protein